MSVKAPSTPVVHSCREPCSWPGLATLPARGERGLPDRHRTDIESVAWSSQVRSPEMGCQALAGPGLPPRTALKPSALKRKHTTCIDHAVDPVAHVPRRKAQSNPLYVQGTPCLVYLETSES